MGEFGTLWRAKTRTRKPELVSVPPVDDREMPAEVQTLYDRLSSRLDDETPVRVGFDGRRWIVGMDIGDKGDGFRVTCVRRHNHWAIPPNGMQVILDSVDYTSQIGGELEKMLAMFTKSSDDQPRHPSVDGPAPAARTNSVETRRRVVIRELWPGTIPVRFSTYAPAAVSR